VERIKMIIQQQIEYQLISEDGAHVHTLAVNPVGEVLVDKDVLLEQSPFNRVENGRIDISICQLHKDRRYKSGYRYTRNTIYTHKNIVWERE